MKRFGSLAVLLCAAALTACDYEKTAVQEITGPLPTAKIKFFNFGINAPSVNFYVNDVKMTAVSFTGCTTPPISEACSTTGVESSSGVGYGGVAAGGLYAGIAPGQQTVSGRISATTDKGLAISSLSATVEDGKAYSFYQTGVYNSTAKTVDAFIVEDPFPAEIDWSAAHVRFVHAIFNANPMTLFATNNETGEEVAVGGGVTYKAAGGFTALPNGIYTLRTRYAGSSTNVLSRTAVSFEAGRVYTITARGDITVAPNTASCPGSSRTCLDNTLNR